MNSIEQNNVNLKNRDGQRHIAAIIMFILLIVRLALSSRLPAYIISYGIHDDAWCTTRALYMLDGQWMGPYNQYTLIKGIFAPLLMAFSKIIGFTYMEICTYLYCVSCIIFLIAVSPVIRSWFSRVIIFAILLFNPITYALETFQRVYRNGLSQWQILLIFGGTIAIFLRRNDSIKKLLPWAVMTGIITWAFFNTREDGIWLLPFIVVSIIVLAVTIFLENSKKLTGRIVIAVIPIFILLIGNITISMINKSVYGTALKNDRDGGYYAEVVKDLYLIAPDPADEAKFSSEEYSDQYYNVYVSTLQKAYDVSPTFKSVQTTVDQAVKNWDNTAGIVGDGQPYGDHILFAIRDGVAAAGYYKTLPETEAFYKQVHEELQDAFDAGTIQKRGISLTAMAAPLQMKDLPDIFAQIPKTIEYIISFEGITPVAIPSIGTENDIYNIEALTGDGGILGSQDCYSISGWAFLFSDDAKMTGGIYTQDGTLLENLSFEGGEDVYEYYKSIGMDYASAKQCRFTVLVPGYTSAEGLVLRTWDANNPENVMECVLADVLSGEGVMSGGLGSENGHINIDQATLYVGSATLQISAYLPYVQRANTVANIYCTLSRAFCFVALFGYVFLCIQLWISRKNLNKDLLAIVLLLTGLLFSFIVFVGAMSYMTVTTFSAQTYLYLSPAYIIVLLFAAVSCCSAVGTAFAKYSR